MTPQEHHAALIRLEEIFDAKPGSPEEHELSSLVETIEAYESVHFQIEKPTPEAAAQFRFEQECEHIPKRYALVGGLYCIRCGCDIGGSN